MQEKNKVRQSKDVVIVGTHKKQRRQTSLDLNFIKSQVLSNPSRTQYKKVIGKTFSPALSLV
jgi:hypothetical protein